MKRATNRDADAGQALVFGALVASSLVSPAAPGTAPAGAIVTALWATTLLLAATRLKRHYPLAAILVLGLPPFLFYVLWHVMGRRLDALLVLGPGSGAAWTVLGESAWSRLAPAAAAPLLAAVALVLLRSPVPGGPSRP